MSGSLGERIWELRYERLLSQEDLARTAGISPSTLSLIENGKVRPHISTLRKIAKALEVKPEALFDTDWSKEKTEGRT